MKAALFLFLAINCAALIWGTGYAAPSGAESQQQSSHSASKTANNDQQSAEQAAPTDGGKDQRDGKPSGEHGESRHVSDKNHASRPARLVRANRLGQVPNNHYPSASRDAANFRQLDSGISGSIQNETANNALHVRPRSGVRLVAPSLNNARHRGPNPAAINGSANLDRKNTATIDGTRMNRKP